MAERQQRVEYFEKRMQGFEALSMPKVRDGATHSYYVHACLWNMGEELDRNAFVDAVRAELPCFELREKEGVKLGAGYVRPLYLLPVFEKGVSIGGKTDPLRRQPRNLNLAYARWWRTSISINSSRMNSLCRAWSRPISMTW